MRYLVLSDIHANLPAFKAVLEAAKGQYDQVLFLGDLANFGPHPVECVELMKEHNAICIMGNHDEQIVAETQKQPWDKWAKDKLSVEQLQWLSEFKDSYIIDGHILVVHGVYTVNYDILPNTPDDDIKSAFKDILAPEIDEVWFGHYHYEINRIIDGVTYRCIRPVGHHRDKDIRASYSIFEGGEIKHYRISYDVDELINALKESDCFETEEGRDTFVDFVRNAFHEGLLKKDLAQLKLNDIRNLYDCIKDNPTACREEGKRLLFNKNSTLDERNYGIKFINRAFSLNDIEAMYLVGTLLINGALKVNNGNSQEHGLNLVRLAARSGFVPARSYLNQYCESKYRANSTTKSTSNLNGPLVDFNGKKIKIDRKGVLTPIDAKLDFINGVNVLTFTTNIMFLESQCDIELPEQFYEAVFDGIKEWEGEYTVFGGQKLIVKINFTADSRIFDNVYVLPMTDDINSRITQIWDKYGTEKIKSRVNNVIGNKRSMAGVGIKRWSVNSRKIILMQSENGKFDDYEELKHVSKHEFGHALGLGDLYRSESDGLAGVKKGSFFETDSYYVTDQIYNLVMSDHHGPISNNDIEMVVLAFSKNRFQNYQRRKSRDKISEALGKGN